MQTIASDCWLKYMLIYVFICACSYNSLNAQSNCLPFSDDGRTLFPKPLTEVNTPTESIDTSKTTKAIVGVRLIDGLGGPPIEDAVVVIRDSLIIATGPSEDIEIPEDAHLYDMNGKTLIPGLIDAHFHSIMNNQLLFQYLKKGVTTLRDPGHPFRFYQSLHFADHSLPRVFLTGAHLDGYPPVWPQQAVVVKGNAHARQTICEHLKKGSTGIKIQYQLPVEYFETIIRTASEYGLPVMAHLELVDADEAIRSGLNGIEHVSSFGTSLADSVESRKFKESIRNDIGYRAELRLELWSKLDMGSQLVQEVIDLAIKNNVVLVPTLAHFERQADDKDVEDIHVKGYRNMVCFVELAHRAGMKIVTGSHVYGVRYVDFGWSYQREMELLVEAGMSPMEVIVSSTADNARYLRTEQRLGSIEKGKLADLLLIDGDPLKDISKMYNVVRVMINGMWVQANS